MKKVTVVGSLNIDHVLKVEKLPLKGETIISNNYNLYEGGKGSNQAASIGRLGISVDMIGKVGKDIYGERLIKNLSKSNVNVSGIIIDDTVSTGTAFITVDKNGNNTIVINPGANGKLTIEEIKELEGSIFKNDIIVLQMEIPRDVVEYLIEKSKEFNKLVLLNLSPPQKLASSIINKVDYLFLNESEMEFLSEVKYIGDNLDVQIKELRKYFHNNIIITLGPDGAMCSIKGSEYKIFQTFDMLPIDRTAAGDAFIGGFIYGLIRNENIDKCVIIGNAAGSMTINKLGAQVSLPNKNELIQFMKQRDIL